MAASAILFAVMSVFVKRSTEGGATPAEVTFVRFLSGLVTVGVLWITGRAQIKATRPLLLAGRGFFGAIAILFFFYSIAHTSLSKANLLSYMWVIYAPLLAALLIRERLSADLAVLLLLSFGGIWLITNPTLEGFGFGEFAGLMAAIFSAIAVVIIRELRRDHSAATIFLSLCSFGTLIGLGSMLLGPEKSTGHPVLPLLGVGITSTAAQLMMTYAYRWCTAAEGSILAMLTPAFGVAFGWMIFGDPITWRMLLGGALILGSGIYLTLRPVDSGVGAET